MDSAVAFAVAEAVADASAAPKPDPAFPSLKYEYITLLIVISLTANACVTIAKCRVGNIFNPPCTVVLEDADAYAVAIAVAIACARD